MLAIDSVVLSFGGREVLSGCYLNCEEKEVVGLLGRNGSGKSSLLKIIFGSLNADFKHLRIDDQVVLSGYRDRRVAYLPQSNFLLPFLVVEQVVKQFPTEVREWLMDIGNFGKDFKSQIRELSHGQQRLLECLWILYLPANYILLDEPFSAIAPVYTEFLQEAIRQRGKEKGIILTDHVYRPLLQVADRVVMLHNNSVYSIREPEDLVRYGYLSDYHAR